MPTAMIIPAWAMRPSVWKPLRVWVVANEYADLYSDSPLRAGRTELDVDARAM